MTEATKKTNAALEKKVRKAVADIQAKGEKPTNAAVREITKGSFRDIGPIVKIVLAEQKAAAEASRAAPEMPEEVIDLYASAWEAAWRCADEAAAIERRAHASQLAEVEEEKAEVLDNIGLVEDERDSAVAEAEAAGERAQQAEERVASLTAELMDAKVLIAKLEGRLLGREEFASQGNSHASNEESSAAPAVKDDSQMSLFPDSGDDRIVGQNDDGGAEQVDDPDDEQDAA
ncbi:plasmid replication DNA-binding protein KfrA [Palleronia aestuarii]|uniref:Plasmid replication DNA-binding protein KfrA n=1 Tax=Palleronia aestuarii TaxID=568105 RepID=A0A2W7NFY9_9RHOB|nr:DNA-binding protein [Palleronia aestuarii]PZX18413.1 plasmid replication DNA-binding protein KfrA [Palleronia aestuarii]